MKKTYPTQAELQSAYEYVDGHLYRRTTGKQVGYRHTTAKSIVVTFKGTAYYIEELIWIYHRGETLGHIVGHRDQNRTNNLIENLCLLSASVRQYPSSNSKSKVPGISWSNARQEWLVHITLKPKVFHTSVRPKRKAIRKLVGSAQELSAAKSLLQRARIHYDKLKNTDDGLSFQDSVDNYEYQRLARIKDEMRAGMRPTPSQVEDDW